MDSKPDHLMGSNKKVVIDSEQTYADGYEIMSFDGGEVERLHGLEGLQLDGYEVE